MNHMCGLDPGPGREKFRVARAIKHLPLIAEAFWRGEVSGLTQGFEASWRRVISRRWHPDSP